MAVGTGRRASGRVTGGKMRGIRRCTEKDFMRQMGGRGWGRRCVDPSIAPYTAGVTDAAAKLKGGSRGAERANRDAPSVEAAESCATMAAGGSGDTGLMCC